MFKDETTKQIFLPQVNLTLVYRDRQIMRLRTPAGEIEEFEILLIFPFTSESKRMGIIVRDTASGEITFVMKGADVVMANIGGFLSCCLF